jgi:predicted nuclease of predicted toxin-antitoxin system
VGEIGMAASSDTDILEHARAAGRIVVTLDADFHAILAVSGIAAPSVIRVRMEGLKGPAIAAIVLEVLAVYASDLAVGCMITVKEQKTTCSLLRGSD